MTDTTVQFNAHQQDLKNRINFLANAIFVLSSGILSISIAIFTQKERVILPKAIIDVLQCSWWLLGASVLFILVTLTSIILRDYFMAEKWRKVIDSGQYTYIGPNKLFEGILLLCGSLGVFSFVLGFIGIIYIATRVIA